MKRGAFIFFSLFISGQLFAQTFSFDNYGVEQGLSQSNVLCIQQDSLGYLWLGTNSGVSRFDGRSFQNYSTDDGLADNSVICMLKDRKGRLWFGHGNGTLTFYDGKKFTAVRSSKFPQDKYIFCLFEARDGKIWAGTETKGAVVIKDPDGDLTNENNFEAVSTNDLDQYVFSIAQDKSGRMWFLTGVGVKYSDKGRYEFLRNENLPALRVTQMMLDRSENIWMGTQNGLIYKYNIKSNAAEKLPVSANTFAGVSALYEDQKGKIWAAVWDNGIFRIAPNGIRQFDTDRGLSVNKIKCIAEDREGNILIGTWGAGLSIFKGERFVSYNVKNGLVNDQVLAESQDNEGNLFFGTSLGISVLPKEEGRPIGQIKELDGKSVRSLVKDREGDIWIGTWGSGVMKYSPSRKKAESVVPINESCNPYVSALAFDRENNLWIGTNDGLFVYSLGSKTISQYREVNGLSGNDITALLADSKGNIWVGTRQKSLSRLKGASITKFKKDEGLTHSNITSIAEGRKGEIWVGTEGGGVYLYNGKTFSSYKQKDGLISDFVTLLTVDDKNNLWIGTNRGLTRFDYGQNVFYSYGKHDGFTGIEAKNNAVFREKNGSIWFGTVNGAYRYNPSEDAPNNFEPLTHLNRLRVNLKDVDPLSSSLELSYKENNLHFDFIGISMTNPEEVKYAVRLVGYDTAWRPVTRQNFEVFSNLNPGDYRFEVMACNNSGKCNENPVSISFHIAPPVWKTWWFYVLVAVFGITLIFSYIKIRERSLVREKKILEEKVRIRTAEVSEKNTQLAQKNKDILDSIRYAKRIQDAILPPDEFVRKYLPKTFILFKPRDIVSGDFYWLSDKQDLVLFAAVDCTGHGVPGAFMSIVGHNLLEKIVNEDEITRPSEIIGALDRSVSYTLRQSYSDEQHAVKDGMDLSVCSFNRKTQVFDFAGAMNPLWLIRDGQLIETKGDKFPVGNLKQGEERKFTNHSIPLRKGDTLYIFSDGFADQFGGPQGKKLKYGKFKETLLRIQHLDMEEQGRELDRIIEEWRGELDQVDDILVIGTRL